MMASVPAALRDRMSADSQAAKSASAIVSAAQVEELQHRRLPKPMTDTERAFNKKYLDELTRNHTIPSG